MIKYPADSLTRYIKDQTDLLYPRKQKHRKDVVFSDRGMNLEQQISESNKYYLLGDTAVVHKRPTPVRIVKVDYPKCPRVVVKEAYFKRASTTDYNDIYRSWYLGFEVRETRNRRSFPLKNFREHQTTHLERCLEQKGTCFTVIRLVTLNRYFVTLANFVIKAWKTSHKSSMTI